MWNISLWGKTWNSSSLQFQTIMLTKKKRKKRERHPSENEETCKDSGHLGANLVSFTKTPEPIRPASNSPLGELGARY
jgi:hypothetical protein